MSYIAKILIAIAIIAGLSGIYYWYKSDSISDYEQSTDTSAAVTTSDTLTTGANTSDSALTEDLTTVDAQMNAFESDNANVTAGLNDEAGAQSSL
jgi:hypothetical protein